MSTTTIELRPEVLAFARLMEQHLRKKDADKGQGWKQAEMDNLSVDATAKVYLIENAIKVGAYRASANMAVDLGNICMFIADVAGALELPATEAKDGNGGAGWAELDQVQMS